MADEAIVSQYLTAMGTGNGTLVRSLFTDDGVIDDYLGGHRAGGVQIETFMNARPRRLIELVGRILVEGDRVTAYTRMEYQDGRAFLVRFIFAMKGDRIQHLSNSSITFVPEEYRIEPSTLLEL